MQDRHVINASYYCKRGSRPGLILVMNTGAYILAEYNESTGDLKWQRVIPAEQKKSIEKWLNQHFPSSHAQQAANA